MTIKHVTELYLDPVKEYTYILEIEKDKTWTKVSESTNAVVFRQVKMTTQEVPNDV